MNIETKCSNMLHQLSVFGAISPNTFNSAVRKRRHPHIFSVSTLYQQIIEYSRRAAISIIKNRILLLKPMFAYHVYSCEQSEYYP